MSRKNKKKKQQKKKATPQGQDSRGFKPTTYTREELIHAIEKTGGIIAAAAKYLNCSRSTVYSWIEKDPQVKIAFMDMKNTVDDEMEGRFLKICRTEGHKDQFKALHFYARTKLKHRGYTERWEDEQAGQSTTITVVHQIPGLPPAEGAGQGNKGEEE